MLKRFLLVLAISSMFTNLCYSNHQSVETSIEWVNDILENKDYCVNKIEGSKIYIHSENIVPTEQGILINLNGYDQVLVPHVSSDLGGCFVEPIPTNNWTDIVPKERCSVCNT